MTFYELEEEVKRLSAIVNGSTEVIISYDGGIINSNKLTKIQQSKSQGLLILIGEES